MMTRQFALLLSLSFFAAACGSDAEGESADNAAVNANNGGKGDIIGEDDRRDEFSEDVTEDMRVLARSTAMIIERASLVEDGRDVSVAADPLGDAYFMCPGETFSEQPSAGMCSAWLVAPDVMVTNGHCITSQSDCEQRSFIFDYALNVENQDLSSVPNETVFHCEKMLAWDNTRNCDVDYAVVKLDRPVTNRPALKVRQAGEEIAGDNLVIIGHPFGLPRKYALEGDVIDVGDNAFTTTHDIFGGNSGSAIFDVESGTVQGLVSCGGSNLWWEFYNEGWSLENKTGQPCEASCDDAGEFTDGIEEATCGDDGQRRRCVCEDDRQLVWEVRDCLAFEDDSDGQCTREARVEEETCRTAPWLCATPLSQHTAHFAHFVGEWTEHGSSDPFVVDRSETFETEFVVEEEGIVQAATFNFIIDEDAVDADGNFGSPDLAALDLNILLTSPGGAEELITVDGEFFANTTDAYTANPANVPRALDIPTQLLFVEGTDPAGTWKLTVTNKDLQPYTVREWSLNLRTVAEDDHVFSVPACNVDCVSPYDAQPDPIIETFDGGSVELADGPVTGDVAEGWSVDILDETGTDYEAFKTRRSQTISLQTGEMALVRDFGEDIGGRNVTIDYRYDGIGWFQVWANDQIIFAKQGFSAATETFPIPVNATKLSFVLGAVDDSQFHELTLFDLRIDLAAQPEPAE
jgi:hypothetical protein